MKWIKIDYENKETLPCDDRIVLATVDPGKFREKGVVQAHYLAKENVWEWLEEAGAPYWSEIYGKVTHWMEYPKPAGDDD